MKHLFNVELAVKYGLQAAVLLEDLRRWTQFYKANNTNSRNGRIWVRRSLDDFHDAFPYLSVKQIRYALKKLEDKGVIKTDNFNESNYDRTKWYAINDEKEV